MGCLRLLLALWVVLVHAEGVGGVAIELAWIPVQCFFMVSGFYMALILNEKYTGPGSWKLFISNRFLRLFPAYWVWLAVTLAVLSGIRLATGDSLGPFGFWQEFGSKVNETGRSFLALANLTVFGQTSVSFISLDQATGTLYPTADFRGTGFEAWRFLLIPQAWSIEIEMLFYLLAPFIVRRSIRTIVLAIAASFLVRAVTYGVFRLTFDPWTYRFFPSELALFLMGSLAYRVWRSPLHERFRSAWFITPLIGLLFLLLLACPFVPLPGQIKAWPIYGLTAVVLPFLFGRTARLRWDRWLGELSYPLYLTHLLFVWVAAWLWPGALETHRLGLPVAVASLVSSWSLMKGVINPLEKIRARRVPPKPPVSAPAG